MPHTILLTGATDGIGRALAELYHARGERLVLIGRRALAELDAPLFTPESYCRADLADDAAPTAIAGFLAEQQIERIDLLIHNAGVGYYGPVEQQTDDSIRALLAVNLAAPIALTHRLLPHVLRTRGRIVFVSSVAALLPAPDYAVYAATKAALEAFARNLAVELRGAATVQIIAPGATRTAMHAKSGAPLARLGWERFPPPEAVARRIAAAIERGRGTATIGLGNRLLRLSGRHLGPLVDRLAAGRR